MESDGLRVAIKAKTAPGAKGLFKAYGAWWNQEVRAWLFKPEGALKLASYLASNPNAIQTDLKTDNASKFIYWGVKKNIKPGRFSAALDIRLFNLNNRFTVLILGGFDRVLHEHITSTLRGTFNPKYEAYIIDGHPQEIVETLRQAHVYPDDVYVNRNVFPTIDIASWRDVPQARLTLGSQDELDPSNLTEEDDPDSQVVTLLHEIAQKPLEKQEINPDLLVWAEKKFSLREYQTQGVQHLLESNASLLADDMGLGKTRQSIVAAFIKYQGGVNVCVVPAYLKINWSREIRALDPKGEIWLPGEYAVDGIRQNHEAYLKGTLNPKWVILSYESMGFILRFLKEKQINLDTNIFDEAHYLKEASSQRTQKGFELASLATNRILLTGTPVLNRVSELYVLLKLSGHPLAEFDERHFDKAFARSKIDRVTLHNALKGWMLRRDKKELNLPGKLRYSYPLEASPSFWEKYKAIEEDKTSIQLVKIGRARELIEREKLGALFELIESLAPSDKAIVFVNFKPTLRELRLMADSAGIKSVGFCGDHSNVQRQACVDQFQNDPETRLIFMTIDAGYSGWTLTKANHVFTVSMPWTPSKLLQCEDRAYRFGQERVVNSIILSIANTIDEPLWQMLEHKAGLSADVMSGENALPTLSLDDQYQLEVKAALEIARISKFGAPAKKTDLAFG